MGCHARPLQWDLQRCLSFPRLLVLSRGQRLGEEQKSVPGSHSMGRVPPCPCRLFGDRWVPAPAPAWLDALSLCYRGRMRLKCRDFLAVVLGREGDLQKCFASSVAPLGLAKRLRAPGSCWSETKLETQLDFRLSSPN